MRDVARFSCDPGTNGDEPLIIGSDVATYSADGRLARVIDFLDKLAS